MDLNKLTPIELHELLYKIVKKLNKLPYVYNEKTRVTHNDYFVSNKQWNYDARQEIEDLIEKYGKA